MKGVVSPWVGGNAFSLLIDGPQFMPAMLRDIQQAQYSVLLELYLVEDGVCSEAWVNALVAAAARGIRVQCLFDGFGSKGLRQTLRQRLLSAKVELLDYNPLNWRRGLLNLYRDHRKILVVDQSCAYVGGTGSTDEFWQPEQAQAHWHELMVRIEGPLVTHWRWLFEYQWQACQSKKPWCPENLVSFASLPKTPLQTTGMGRLAYADASEHLDIVKSLLSHLARSKQRIWLATPYFLPSLKVRRFLRRAAKRGVDVRLLLTGKFTDHPGVRYAGQRYYRRLLKAGVRVFEYQPRFIHLKMVLADDWVSVGSCNFDHWNLRFNLEANLETLDPDFSAAVKASFEADFAQSKELTYCAWRKRPLSQRLLQRLCGLIDRVVLSLFDRRRG